MNNRHIYLSIILQVKCKDKEIVKLEAIKFSKDIFRYLSFYFHCSFFWYLIIITFIILSSFGYQNFCIVRKTSTYIIVSSDCPQTIQLLRPWVIIEK